ncbi:site-specific DNA-methyltransferase [Mesorhizobium sp. RIZ17]|uniref:site-specific DNA-methyltransferase n=1 Tax=Mesorhizobium sp. RIZ17 TaxID=3132743 RepID=UPI003DA92FA7
MPKDGFQGKLIKGDNSVVLDRMIAEGTVVSCAYIDPPYNNKDRFDHYEDNKDYDIWEAEIIAVSSKIRSLLSEEGSLWVSIDDKLMHYLKVALDNVFGRENFISTVVWEHRTTRENRAIFSNNHEYILVYAKNFEKFKSYRNPLPFTDEWKDRFKNPDNDPRGPWQSVSANAQAGHATAGQFYELVAPSGKRHLPPKGRCWLYTQARMNEAMREGRIYFGKGGSGVPRIKRYLREVKGGLTPHTLWKADEVGTTASAKKHLLDVLADVSVFETPKPEQLISRILSIASNPGDLVLDAYLGSGTTASVAHKMDRRYVGIELGEHIASHCVRRLRSVCQGEQGGISKAVNWLGGGDFDLEDSAVA